MSKPKTFRVVSLPESRHDYENLLNQMDEERYTLLRVEKILAERVMVFVDNGRMGQMYDVQYSKQ
jgi:hypothetical protein